METQQANGFVEVTEINYHVEKIGTGKAKKERIVSTSIMNDGSETARKSPPVENPEETMRKEMEMFDEELEKVGQQMEMLVARKKWLDLAKAGVARFLEQ